MKSFALFWGAVCLGLMLLYVMEGDEAWAAFTLCGAVLNLGYWFEEVIRGGRR